MSVSISLIGSFRRHYPVVVEAARIFNASGLAVRSPTISRVINPGAEFVRFASDSPTESNDQIQLATLRRILASDVVYVVCPDGYLGNATSWELGLIQERGIAVFFSEHPRDLPIAVAADRILTPHALVARLTAKPLSRPRVRPWVTSDLVVLTIRGGHLNVLLVRRGTKPFHGMLALPGGFVRPGEALEDAARRELAEETGLSASRLALEQLHTYSAPDRDPRGRVTSTAFLAIAPDLPIPRAGTDAHSADWIEVEESLRTRLAFDHWQILCDGIDYARGLLERTTVATAFCGDLFTLTELRHVYETVWGTALDAANFRRKVNGITGFVEPAGDRRKSRSGRPPELYRRGTARLLNPPMFRT